jgi:hypothetical protein
MTLYFDDYKMPLASSYFNVSEIAMQFKIDGVLLSPYAEALAAIPCSSTKIKINQCPQNRYLHLAIKFQRHQKTTVLTKEF